MALVRKRTVNSRHELEDRFAKSCREDHLIIDRRSAKYKELLILESNRYELSRQAFKEVAKFLGIEIFEPPTKYKNWIPGFCEILMCIKYFNPRNHMEYITIPEANTPSGTIRVLHHGEEGYDCVEYFNEFFPLVDLNESYQAFKSQADRKALEQGKRYRDVDIGSKPYRSYFSRHIGKAINKTYPDMDPMAAKAVYALIDIYVPSIEGICASCFKVRFPQSGLGIVYKSGDGYNKMEVKVSPPKLDSQHAQQRELYVTNELRVEGRAVYIQWHPWHTKEPLYTEDAGDLYTHTPWDVHDQSQLNALLTKDMQEKKIQQFIQSNKEVRLSLCSCS